MRTQERPNKSRETDDETKGSNKIKKKKKTKYACTVEAHESTRKPLESTLPKDHEDHIAEKRFNPLSHYNWVRKFVPMHRAMRNPDAKAAVDKEWEKLDTIPAWQLVKFKIRKEVILEAQKENKNSPFCFIGGHLSSQTCGVRTEISEVQRQNRAPRWHCERRFRLVCRIHGARSASQMTAATVMDVAARLPDCAGQAADAVSAYTQVKNGGCSEFQSQNVQKNGYVFRNTSGPNHGQTLKTQLLSLERNLHGHPRAGLLWERQFEEVLLGFGWKEVPNWECMFVHRKQGLFSSVTWMTLRWLERSSIWLPRGRNWWKMLILTNQLHFLITKIWDALNVNVNRKK